MSLRENEEQSFAYSGKISSGFSADAVAPIQTNATYVQYKDPKPPVLLLYAGVSDSTFHTVTVNWCKTEPMLCTTPTCADWYMLMFA